MSGITKLILKNWFTQFLASVLVLTVLISVANLIAGFLRGNVSAIEVLKNHLIEMPGYINQILPVSCLVASLFAINKLKARSELTAIFASGYSRLHFIFIIIFAASMVGMFQFLTAAYIDPIAKKSRHMLMEDGEEKFKNLESKGLRSSTIGSGNVWYKSGNYYFSFTAFDKASKVLKNVNLYFYDENYLVEQHISSPHVEFVKNNTWSFKDVKITKFLNHVSYPELKTYNSFQIKLNENPIDFDKIEADTTTLNIQELSQYITRLDRSGINTNQYKVLLYDKYATSILCIIFGVLSSVAIFSPNRRSSAFGKNILFVFAFTLLYWFISSYLADLGKVSKVPPEISSFLVPSVFICYLMVYFYFNRRLR